MKVDPRLRARARLRLLAVVLLGLCGACDDGSAGKRVRTPATSVPFGSFPESGDDLRSRLADPGIDGLKTHFVGSGDDELLLIELDAATFEPALVGEPQTGTSAQQALVDHDFVVVVGSGFVSELKGLEPVGLLQVQGQTLSPVQMYGYTRILGINDDGIGVVHRDAYQRDLFHSALQVGPGIIEQGKLDISERDLERPEYFRSFLAICADRWIAGASMAPTHLRTLGRTLEDFFQAAQWRCDDVVNLAGDRQAVLLVSTADHTVIYHGDPNTYKASLLGFALRR